MAIISDVKTINNYLYIKKLSAFVDGLKENGVDRENLSKVRELYDKDQERF